MPVILAEVAGAFLADKLPNNQQDGASSTACHIGGRRCACLSYLVSMKVHLGAVFRSIEPDHVNGNGSAQQSTDQFTILSAVQFSP